MMSTYKTEHTSFEYDPNFAKDSAVNITTEDGFLTVPSEDIVRFVANNYIRMSIEQEIQKKIDALPFSDFVLGKKRVVIDIEDL